MILPQSRGALNDTYLVVGASDMVGNRLGLSLQQARGGGCRNC